MRTIAVVGSGTFGTAIAGLLRAKDMRVQLWSFEEDVARAINEKGYNPAYLQQIALDGVHATTDVAQAVEGAEAIVLVTPSFAVRSTARSLASHVPDEVPVVVLSKGIDAQSDKPFIEVLADELGHPERLAVLSGPNHAEEIAAGATAGTVVASTNAQTAEFFQELLATETFRIYTSDDPLGVSLCGAVKNPIAIACGIARGLDFGDNGIALLMTRGLAEITRLVVACGGKRETCLGLAGVGDLFVTCNSHHSRNGSFGETFARTGETVQAYEARLSMVVEGAHSAQAILNLAQQHNVDMPITSAVERVLEGETCLNEIVEELVARPLKPEFTV